MLVRDVTGDEFAYWWKLAVPSFLFGSKYAILIQLAIIPITMSRYSIAALSGSVVENFIPLNRMLRIHALLGYAMFFITITAAMTFITYFGVMCRLGEAEYCDGLKSEIMITGYAIAALATLVTATSHFRHRIPYEWFYAVHHIVLVLYILIVLHTIDAAQRSGKNKRYQSFPWVTICVLYYFCDRAFMYINQRYDAKVSNHHILVKLLSLACELPSLNSFTELLFVRSYPLTP